MLLTASLELLSGAGRVEEGRSSAGTMKQASNAPQKRTDHNIAFTHSSPHDWSRVSAKVNLYCWKYRGCGGLFLLPYLLPSLLLVPLSASTFPYLPLLLLADTFLPFLHFVSFPVYPLTESAMGWPGNAMVPGEDTKLAQRPSK